MAVLLEAVFHRVATSYGRRLEVALNRLLDDRRDLQHELLALLVQPQDDHGTRLSSIWRSRPAAETFQRDVLLPHLSTEGLPEPDRLQLLPFVLP